MIVISPSARRRGSRARGELGSSFGHLMPGLRGGTVKTGIRQIAPSFQPKLRRVGIFGKSEVPCAFWTDVGRAQFLAERQTMLSIGFHCGLVRARSDPTFPDSNVRNFCCCQKRSTIMSSPTIPFGSSTPSSAGSISRRPGSSAARRRRRAARLCAGRSAQSLHLRLSQPRAVKPAA